MAYPRVNEAENIYPFDVDGTLVIECQNQIEPPNNALKIKNPHSKVERWYIPHQRHIDLLKTMKPRGRFVKVWSGSGALWACTVLEALGLADDRYVDEVEGKPQGVVDDLPPEKILPNRIYLRPDGGQE